MTPEQQEQSTQVYQAYKEGRMSKKMLKKCRRALLKGLPLPLRSIPVVPEEDPWDEMLALIPPDPPALNDSDDIWAWLKSYKPLPRR